MEGLDYVALLVGVMIGGGIGVLLGWVRCYPSAMGHLSSGRYIGGLRGALLGVLLAGAVGCTPGQATQNPTERSLTAVKAQESNAIINLGDEEAFEEAVLNSSTPVVVDFWAPWCGPCRAQSPILDRLANERGDDIRIVKVNVDELSGLARRYHIQAIPTLMIFQDGKKMTHLVGLQSLEDLNQALEM